MLIFGMLVVVEPVKVAPVPLKVCTGACAVNVVALLVNEPEKLIIAAAPAVVSFHIPPELMVTAPLKAIVRVVALLDPKFIVPVTTVFPFTVKLL